ETIAQHDIAARKGRLNHLVDMLRPVRRKKKELSLGRKREFLVKQEVPDGRSECGATGLSRDENVLAGSTEMLCNAFDKRGFAGTFYSFESDEHEVVNTLIFGKRRCWKTQAGLSASSSIPIFFTDPDQLRTSLIPDNNCRVVKGFVI